MQEYEITIGYKAVVTIMVKAKNESEAKEKGINVMKKQRDKMFQLSSVLLYDDNIKAGGCLNMDETWNIINY